MCTAAGLPAGAINVVTGLGPDAGGALSNHEDIDKLSFTGSVPTARKIMAVYKFLHINLYYYTIMKKITKYFNCYQAAAQGPRGISLELGGKSPLIVFEDADISSAVDWILTGILWGSGQVCSATSRVLVHKSIKAPLLKLLIEKAAAVRIGNSLDPEMISYSDSGKPTMGPVVSRGQYDKIWSIIDNAKSQGFHFAYGGDRKLVSHLGKGYFIPPTVNI
jgi:betaine-aldehyde dehydrogenase